MAQLQLKQIGSIIKVHGIRKELLLSLKDNCTFELVDEFITEGNAIFVEINGISVPFFVAENGLKELNQNSALIRFDDTSEKLVKEMVSAKVFIENRGFETADDTDSFRPEDLVGYKVIDKKANFKGEIKEFINLKGNPMFNIVVGEKTMLLPVISDFILSVDNKKKLISLELPDGYLEAML